MSKRKSSNDLDRPLPKQRKQAKVEINTKNCFSARRAFAELRAGDMQLSKTKKLVRLSILRYPWASCLRPITRPRH